MLRWVQLGNFVSILILMDLPFLLYLLENGDDAEKCFNPYSNGSSFFIVYCLRHQLLQKSVSILILMDLPFLFGYVPERNLNIPLFQSLF